MTYSFHFPSKFTGPSHKEEILAIKKLGNPVNRASLETYISRGSQLGQDESIRALSKNISDVMNIPKDEDENENGPSLFFFVDASSGKGKSQLALSLQMPVVFIPLAFGQKIYSCFFSVSTRILDELRTDCKESDAADLDSVVLYTTPTEFHTVGLLVALYKKVYGLTNEESHKLLTGYNDKNSVEYEPMTLQAAREDIAQFVQNQKSKN